MKPFRTARQALNWYWRNRSKVNHPNIIKYRKEPAAPIRIDFSNKLLERVIDIGRIYEECEYRRYLQRFHIDGESRWCFKDEERPKLGAVRREFARKLREGGLIE